MVVAYGASNFPRPVFVLPEVDESAFADRLSVLMPWMVKAMNAHFDRPIALHVINLQRFGKKFSRRFAANVVLNAFRELCAAEGNAPPDRGKARRHPRKSS
jgi:hypothetical protein